MRVQIGWVGAALTLLLMAPAAQGAPSPPAAQPLWLATHAGRLRAYAFASSKLSAHPHLVVVFHGDLDHPDYHYRFARMAANALADTVAVGVLRPGYTDSEGDRSDGARGAMSADNYTPQVLSSLAAAIVDLKARYQPHDVTLVGHSGGSAIAADLLETRPELARRALLVSCPCDVRAFRRHMLFKQLDPGWLIPTRSLSPMDRVVGLAGDRIAMAVGGADDVAPSSFSKAFATAARHAGAHVALQVLPGEGHNILLEPPVMAMLDQLQEGQP